MITREELQGSWTQLKGKIRERWGQITDDDLQHVQGNAEQLIGLLERKTGQSRRDIEQFVETSLQKGDTMLNQAAETARDYASRASQQMRESYEDAQQRMEEGYEQAEEMVRSRPFESAAAAFGAGVIAGILVSLMLRGSRS